MLGFQVKTFLPEERWFGDICAEHVNHGFHPTLYFNIRETEAPRAGGSSWDDPCLVTGCWSPLGHSEPGWMGLELVPHVRVLWGRPCWSELRNYPTAHSHSS